MPSCGSQVIICDLPIHFDTYNGCSHACKYCFAKKFTDISKIKTKESVVQLKNFIEGKRDENTKWCTWNIPIHWGGLSDPFQPCEKDRGVSLECLKLLKETQYPFVVSTKGKLIIEEPYLSLISQCNCVIQISAVCKSFNILEPGAPDYDYRLKMAEILSKKGNRVIIRIQPYMHEVFKEVFNNLKRLKQIGVYGVIIEGIKFRKQKPGLVKVGGDFCYSYDLIKSDFLKLRDEAHRVGLKIYAGENRIREFGDNMCCCGVDGLVGFKPNSYNLSHILKNDKVKPDEQMKKIGTSNCFKTINQSTIATEKYKQQSFAYSMVQYYNQNKNNVSKIVGIKEK